MEEFCSLLSLLIIFVICLFILESYENYEYCYSFLTADGQKKEVCGYPGLCSSSGRFQAEMTCMDGNVTYRVNQYELISKTKIEK